MDREVQVQQVHLREQQEEAQEEQVIYLSVALAARAIQDLRECYSVIQVQ
jgi:hypothetical protein